MVKRYDAGTRTDANNRMVGHFCPRDSGVFCGHCEQKVPFMYPPEDFWPQISDRTLTVLEVHAMQQIDEATAALKQIQQQRVERD